MPENKDGTIAKPVTTSWLVQLANMLGISMFNPSGTIQVQPWLMDDSLLFPVTNPVLASDGQIYDQETYSGIQNSPHDGSSNRSPINREVFKYAPFPFKLPALQRVLHNPTPQTKDLLLVVTDPITGKVMQDPQIVVLEVTSTSSGTQQIVLFCDNTTLEKLQKNELEIPAKYADFSVKNVKKLREFSELREFIDKNQDALNKLKPSIKGKDDWTYIFKPELRMPMFEASSVSSPVMFAGTTENRQLGWQNPTQDQRLAIPQPDEIPAMLAAMLRLTQVPTQAPTQVPTQAPTHPTQAPTQVPTQARTQGQINLLTRTPDGHFTITTQATTTFAPTTYVPIWNQGPVRTQLETNLRFDNPTPDGGGTNIPTQFDQLQDIHRILNGPQANPNNTTTNTPPTTQEHDVEPMLFNTPPRSPNQAASPTQGPTTTPPAEPTPTRSWIRWPWRRR